MVQFRMDPNRRGNSAVYFRKIGRIHPRRSGDRRAASGAEFFQTAAIIVSAPLSPVVALPRYDPARLTPPTHAVYRRNLSSPVSVRNGGSSAGTKPGKVRRVVVLMIAFER